MLQFSDKRALDLYIGKKDRMAQSLYKSKLMAEGKPENEASTAALFYGGITEEQIIECLKHDGYDLEDLTANGDSYQLGPYTNRPAKREIVIERLLELYAIHRYWYKGRLYATPQGQPEEIVDDVTDFTVRQLIDWLGE